MHLIFKINKSSIYDISNLQVDHWRITKVHLKYWLSYLEMPFQLRLFLIFYALVWSVNQNQSFNDKTITNEPKNLTHNVCDSFLEKIKCKLERAQSGGASLEK